ncbi:MULTISPECIES: cytolethal distending toxin subunit B family protein [unclassified Helicobacter]|uniref:cytolethal distending toxin subunit B family protein n=1 Tax=unclassified Helicobacter TaxID=2593540 RepID=UPI000CF10546|nr:MULTISPECIES: cytolethal distending toxin subunit B family protein [unclassified Helicobacter]
MRKKFIFITILLSQLLFADIGDYNIGTWNLQGASASSENKWNVVIRQLMYSADFLNILMLQEAGAVPSTATPTERHIQPGGTPVREYIWQAGTRSRPRQVYIYHADIDVGARRVNLAIVSDRRADEVYVIRQTSIAPENSRPALGIRIGNDAFFSVHALANGGGDASALVTAIHDNFNNMPDITYLIAGDFNREPANLLSGIPQRVENNIRIVSPRDATHAGSRGTNRILDYGIIGRTSTGAASILPQLVALLASATLTSYLASDHFPVRFRRF